MLEIPQKIAYARKVGYLWFHKDYPTPTIVIIVRAMKKVMYAVFFKVQAWPKPLNKKGDNTLIQIRILSKGVSGRRWLTSSTPRAGLLDQREFLPAPTLVWAEHYGMNWN
ncbi:hypothetical protein EVAR_28461_1 [Eumeta japonica]|uniref:Uncharacterized protein n=1 Tax=Eumeta variegata TaxID=151549 RepID=A0A4C1V8W1_EUMVA|nr:hypothetical protein EVAR_28461_1 [Eumeta japonica]